jgi:hypothetical protein
MSKYKTVFLVPTKVVDIAEEFKITTGYRTKVDDHPGGAVWPVYKTSQGWFVLFEGSRERLFVGDSKPADLDIGDKVMIAVMKRVDQ